MLRTAFLSALIALAGCTPLQKEKYTFAGGDFSEVTFETDAPNWIVNVGISTSEVDCKGFRSAGKLFYDAQLRGGGFLGGLQKLNPIRPDENLKVTRLVPANSTLQIQASAVTTGAGVRDLRPGYHQIQNRGFQQVQSLCWAKGRLLFPNCYRYCRKFPNRGADTVQVTGLTKQSTGLRKKPRRPVISDVSSLNIP